MAAAPARVRAAQLFNLLAAHAALDPELGYAQGCRPPPPPNRPHSLCVPYRRRQGVSLTRLEPEMNTCMFCFAQTLHVVRYRRCEPSLVQCMAPNREKTQACMVSGRRGGGGVNWRAYIMCRFCRHVSAVAVGCV